MDSKVTKAAEHQTNEKLKSVLKVISCIEKAGVTRNDSLGKVKELCSNKNSTKQ